MSFIYKWLPIIFGCHGKAERSFFIRGKKLPICARCTGELIGIIFGLCSYIIYRPTIYLTMLLMAPMIIDGFLQLWTSYESKNWKRFTTGFLFGYALITIFLISAIYTYKCGYTFGLEYFNIKD